MSKEYLSGLIAAPFTPMDAEGNINLDAISSYSDLLKGNGVSGVFVCGTTGEGASLSPVEKKAIIKEWIHCSDGGLKIIAHVGGLCQSESKELAEYALQNGADAIAAMAPFFFKPESAEDLLLFFQPVAAAAPGLPFYYYHIPTMTGVNIPVSEILIHAQEMIPNFAGVKFTHSDLMDLQQCLDVDNGRYEILFGSDEILISGLSLGTTSAVGSTYNYMAPVYLSLIEAFKNHDFEAAREYQQFSVKTVEILKKNGGAIRAGKAIMEFVGVECGPCRLPLSDMSDGEKKSLKQALLNIGFFEKIEYEVLRTR